MSQLIVIAYEDKYRASEVLNELKRRKWDWTADLNDAVAISIDELGKTKVHFSPNSSSQVTSWTMLWQSLMKTTLFLRTENLPSITRDPSTSTEPDHAVRRFQEIFPTASWWKDELRLSQDFIRDVGAIVNGSGSAIFMRLQTDEGQSVLAKLRNYGTLIIRTTLSREQDDKITELLTRA